MSKRPSVAQSNTLLNYFQSPKGKTPAKTNGTKKENNSDSEQSQSAGTSGKSDESPVQANKRRKIIIIDSDSEEESASKPTPKKRGVKRQSDTSSGSSSENDEKTGTKKPRLQKFAFDKTNAEPSLNTSVASGSLNQSTLATADVNSDWLHNRLDFLKPEKIRDINKNKPTDADYDPRTLLVPHSFLEQQTPAMRQWWILKSSNADSVLFFKVGKFYELYHMDAVVGVNHLDFSYMKAQFAHSGFPEIAYHKMANILIEKGFKVARVEQTETNEMMDERCKKMKKTTKFDKVVNREVCQITTKGTCVYTAQMPDAMHDQSCHLYAISEREVSDQKKRLGICFIDTSIGVFYMSEFEDDKYCSKLLKCLSEYPPGLILTERKNVSSKLQTVLSTHYADVKKETLAPESQFYSAAATIEKLMNGTYFRDSNNELHLPSFIVNIADGYNAKPELELTVKALGACLWYLINSKLDIQVVSMGKFQFYNPLNMDVEDEPSRSSMILDAVTIENLNLLGPDGSLQKVIDHCQTAFGKRLLQQWICRPLCNINQIRERQGAIRELRENLSLLEEAQAVLKKLPDLERQLAKIHAYGNLRFAENHPDSRAVFYEAGKYSKRRIADLLSTLQGFELAQNISPMFKGCNSELLKRLTQFGPDGKYVDLSDPLIFFKNAFDQEEAQKDGKIIPKRGVDEKYDLAEEAIDSIKKESAEYLVEMQKFFGCKVSYFGSDKKRYQIDVPANHANKATSDFQLKGTKNGSKPSKRYTTPRSLELLANMMNAESERGKIVQDLNRRIFEKFSERAAEWEQAINCICLLDVLCSMARYAKNVSEDMCIPVIERMIDSENKVLDDSGDIMSDISEISFSEFANGGEAQENSNPASVENVDDEVLQSTHSEDQRTEDSNDTSDTSDNTKYKTQKEVNKILIKNGRHPCVTAIQDYVPNDTKLGYPNYPNILLLTGPNMGGKSTLMRQVAVICIMAHMGGYVPASGCQLNLIDRIFTRLGAHDDIVQGQSTFLLELSEAATILNHATRHSLVLLDELGRGTSTHDGNAIATAYVEKLTKMNCRTLFSTHYHSLIDHFEDRQDVQLGHMACMVEKDEDPTEEAVTFLYKMAQGRCPKSYGFNVAKLAGLKQSIISRGREVADDLENESRNSMILRQLLASVDADYARSIASSNDTQ